MKIFYGSHSFFLRAEVILNLQTMEEKYLLHDLKTFNTSIRATKVRRSEKAEGALNHKAVKLKVPNNPQKSLFLPSRKIGIISVLGSHLLSPPVSCRFSSQATRKPSLIDFSTFGMGVDAEPS